MAELRRLVHSQVAQLPAGVQAELLEDAAQVSFDRARAEEQLPGRLLGGGAIGDEQRDLAFLRGEQVERRGGRLAGTLPRSRAVPFVLEPGHKVQA
ncbi:hypothetical protein GCM10027176_38040 [Actinoallomurus bryophytorum]